MKRFHSTPADSSVARPSFVRSLRAIRGFPFGGRPGSRLAILVGFALAMSAGPARAESDDLPPAPVGDPVEAVTSGVESQPFFAAADRLIEAMRHLGAPIPEKAVAEIDAARSLAFPPDGAAPSAESAAGAVVAAQRALDPLCLLEVHINPESRVKVARGPAPAELAQKGWRAFLVKVRNEAGVTARLAVSSPHALQSSVGPANLLDAEDVDERWMAIDTFDDRPMNETLSGLPLEYRIVRIYSRDRGRREATIAFDVGQGTQDIGFRNDVAVLFHCRPSVEVSLRVRDEKGRPTMASFVVTDLQGRIHPHPSKRLEPDFYFHDQVYRADGETLDLAPGIYFVRAWRGPEYLAQSREVEIRDPDRWTEGEPREQILEFDLKRWIDPNARGWYSGDHHIHAAGCLHYHSPTIGVGPEAMMRHVMGEAINVGCVLTWGPGWYHQKQQFTGIDSPVSRPDSLLRYDVEISGFPSDHCGHLVLLRLKEDDYPGTEEKQHWPTWTLPILQWAKGQGAVTGVAHSGWGLDVWPEDSLPNYVIPPMNGIGAQEYLVDVVHDAVDFLSAGDTPYVWELNMWYHTLNCGFRTKISGETDFPCIYGDRVGMARSYVKLGEANVDRVDFDEWTRGVAEGRCYVGDGRSHLMDFAIEGPAGEEGSDSAEPARKVAAAGGTLALEAPGTVRVRVDAAALLPPDAERMAPRGTRSKQLSDSPEARREKVPIRDLPYNQIPYWHLERARLGDSRLVPVEVVVNGQVARRLEIEADGVERALEFDLALERSSWVAARILPSSHTNPVFVTVADAPIRASRRSALWCLRGVEKVWKEKSPRIQKARGEYDAAVEAFDRARKAYRAIVRECPDDTGTGPFELALEF